MPSAVTSRRLPMSRDTALIVTSVVTWCAMTMFVVSPLVAPFLLTGCLLTALAWHFFDPPRLTTAPLTNASFFSVAFGGVSRNALAGIAALVAWFALSTLWSVNPRDAAFAAFLFAASGAIVLMAAALLNGLERDVQRAIGLAFTFAIGFSMWLSLEENASGMYLRRAINSLVPMTRPNSIHMRMENGWIASMQPYMSNKNTVAVLLMTWPMVLVSGVLVRSRNWSLARSATLIAVVLAIAVSEHETSKLALLISAGVFGLALRSQRAAFAVVAAGWVAATLLIVPVSLMAFKTGAFRSDTLQYSARHRIVIWGHTAVGVLKKPFLGNGLASTRVLDEMAKPTKERVAGTDLIEGTNVHAHNVFLQTWYETGAVGAVLMFLAGLPVLAWLRSRPPTIAPHLFAAFTASVTVASLSWSLVASWYIAAFGLVAVWCRFADVFVRNEARPPGSAGRT